MSSGGFDGVCRIIDGMTETVAFQLRLPADLHLAVREQSRLRNRSMNLEVEIACRLAVALGTLSEAEQRLDEPGAAEAIETCREEVATLVRLAYGRDSSGRFLAAEALRDLVSAIPSTGLVVHA